jgi:hypothetical protein
VERRRYNTEEKKYVSLAKEEVQPSAMKPFALYFSNNNDNNTETVQLKEYYKYFIGVLSNETLDKMLQGDNNTRDFIKENFQLLINDVLKRILLQDASNQQKRSTASNYDYKDNKKLPPVTSLLTANNNADQEMEKESLVAELLTKIQIAMNNKDSSSNGFQQITELVSLLCNNPCYAFLLPRDVALLNPMLAVMKALRPKLEHKKDWIQGIETTLKDLSVIKTVIDEMTSATKQSLPKRKHTENPLEYILNLISAVEDMSATESQKDIEDYNIAMENYNTNMEEAVAALCKHAPPSNITLGYEVALQLTPFLDNVSLTEKRNAWEKLVEDAFKREAKKEKAVKDVKGLLDKIFFNDDAQDDVKLLCNYEPRGITLDINMARKIEPLLESAPQYLPHIDDWKSVVNDTIKQHRSRSPSPNFP